MWGNPGELWVGDVDGVKLKRGNAGGGVINGDEGISV
jgi:hypothetical protein